MRLVQIIIAKIVYIVNRIRWSPVGYCPYCRRPIYGPGIMDHCTGPDGWCAEYKRSVFGGGK